MSDPVSPGTVSWQDVFAAEQALLRGRQHHSHCRPNGPDTPDYLTGICLSGGGIRSATVSLGIMQVLAGAGMVKHLDYMSSVSGGGYAASGVAFGYGLGPADADPDDAFPFGAVDPADATARRPETPRLRFLRNHADYLAQNGLPDLATGVVVVARSLLLNIFLWVTILGTGLALLLSGFQWLMEQRIGGTAASCRVLYTQCSGNAFFDALLFTALGLALALGALMVGFSLSSWRLETAPPRADQPPARIPQWAFGLLAIGCAVAAFAIAVNALGRPSVWGQGLFSGVPTLWGEYFPFAAVLALAALGFLAIVIGPCWFCGSESISRKYARRRFQESFCGTGMLLVLALALVGSLPIIRDLLAKAPMLSGLAGADGRGPLSALVYLVGLGSALYGFYRGHLAGKLGLGSSFLVVAGSMFLCFGVLLLSYETAAGLQRVVREGFVPVSFADTFTITAPLVAALLALVVNINDVGLGRFYRDRLMEAFMPDEAAAEQNRLAAATTADRFRLVDLVRDKRQRLVGPYPLVNVNVMTHAIGDAVARSRGGDNFVLGPAGCGSTSTGFRRTSEIIESRLTLATAMATSGAAANPRGGFAGTGPTTNPVVALAMSILSIRLGYWLRWNPGPRIRRFLNPHGNHIVPVAGDVTRQILGFPHRPGAFIELTDGGHFENLGLYELVRRRCGLILVCDGGDDRLASYASFVAAARRIEEDFGATFSFDMKVAGETLRCSGPAEVVARAAENEYPKEAEYATRGYFLATIRYGDPALARVPMAADGATEGLVIYLKSALIPAVSLVTRGYKGAFAEFPYESTADQFFSPEQFEAYRDVGVCITRQMLEETGLDKLFGRDRPPLSQLRRNLRFGAPAPVVPPPPGEAPVASRPAGEAPHT